MKINFKSALVVPVVCGLFATVALAVVNVDTDGKGFVGKGDVQLALGLSNAQLQAATLAFTVATTSVSETGWTCSKVNNADFVQTNERERTTTTSTTGVASSVARVKNQITGFNLGGFTGGTTTTVSTDGPAAGSCPTGWTASDQTTTSVPGGTIVSVNGVPMVAPVL